MRHLVFTPDRNSTVGHDYTGAFKPESERYKAFYEGQGDIVDVWRVNVSERLRDRAAVVYLALDPARPIDRLVFLCHGWRSGIQLGLTCDSSQLAPFVARLVAASTPKLCVALFCCSTGASDSSPDGEGGFADTLHDHLCAAGRPDVRVFAHTTAGHTTRNANARLFAGDRIGGVDIARPGTPEFHKLSARLHDVADPLRWRLPYLSPAEALEELK